MDIQSSTTTCRDPFNESSFSNQLFLINFIMGSYLGPDVYSDIPRRSAFQRLAQCLPPYTANNLGSSFVSFSQLENLYYYVLRKAHPNLVLKPNVFHTYLNGNLPLPSSGVPKDCKQFTSFFPPNLHVLKRHSDSYGIVKGIVLIGEPLTSYMEKDDLERFLYLSGMDNLKIDVNNLQNYRCNFRKSGEEFEQSCTAHDGEEIAATISNGNSKASEEFLETYKRRRRCDLLPTPASHCLVPFSKYETEMGGKSDGHVLMPLTTISHLEEHTPFQSITFTGTAENGIAGPPFGALEIGVSKASYFFRIALPGSRKDFGQLNCEIESNGKVRIEGAATTGGRSNISYSRVFEMNLQQFSMPVSFALTFHLPGPVDPRLFSPNLRCDGIFEGVVVKHLCSTS
ncbi:hypothetical protein HS088_TW12G00483 [Tripterygium wilfordii]|uniref:Increased DNA methylation 3 n=1 Tax=Tripterygium wilfordii TaxID=458696 RepID=A0A7J7CZ00_TRIWF|nr:increased DNA methylation 3 [Tripterygium wilfordii]KAF5739280.1 hypothetical protein HS088_TW12G00483 [Tripterygium wilfordii]